MNIPFNEQRIEGFFLIHSKNIDKKIVFLTYII